MLDSSTNHRCRCKVSHFDSLIFYRNSKCRKLYPGQVLPFMLRAGGAVFIAITCFLGWNLALLAIRGFLCFLIKIMMLVTSLSSVSFCCMQPVSNIHKDSGSIKPRLLQAPDYSSCTTDSSHFQLLWAEIHQLQRKLCWKRATKIIIFVNLFFPTKRIRTKVAWVVKPPVKQSFFRTNVSHSEWINSSVLTFK